jgi:hypothetical protein
MLRRCFSVTRPIGPGVLALLLALAPSLVASAQPTSAAVPQPGLYLAGTQLPDVTRYSVTVNNQTQTTLSDLRVSVQLPEDAVFDHALETPGFTQFQATDGQTLTWQGGSFGPNDVIDAFTFFLAQPASGTFSIGATWGGDSPGDVQSQLQPSVRTATETDGDVTINAAALAQGSAPVGHSGVVLDALSGEIPDGTTLHVHVLGPDNNPAGVPGDLWWCSIVEVDGLPAGAGVLLEVPARQPLPPGATIQLFGQDGAHWDALPDTAQVSADGQSILYVHHGGVVATGTASNVQPLLPSGATVNPTLVRQFQASQITLEVEEQALAQLMVLPAHCPPGNCGALPPCFNTQLIAGTPCANASIRTPLSSVSGQLGQTSCQVGGGPCIGFVGILPSGVQPGGVNATDVPAPAGHGTWCRFAGFTEVTTGLTCSQF